MLFKGIWALHTVAEVITIDAQLQQLATRSKSGKGERSLVRKRITSLMQSREQIIGMTDAERKLREYMGN